MNLVHLDQRGLCIVCGIFGWKGKERILVVVEGAEDLLDSNFFLSSDTDNCLGCSIGYEQKEDI